MVPAAAAVCCAVVPAAAAVCCAVVPAVVPAAAAVCCAVVPVAAGVRILVELTNLEIISLFILVGSVKYSFFAKTAVIINSTNAIIYTLFIYIICIKLILYFILSCNYIILQCIK